jgi:xylan 1,4-beta-xylosidase
VSQWFFEVWNEPNFPAFWTGTQDDYFKLYGHTAQAIKAVDASLRVGGPATAMTGWIDELLDYCERNRLPVDFISTHIYATDPLGFEGANTEEQLANSPRDLMRDRAKLVREHSRERPVYFTEWNISSNPRDLYHDEPFAAAYAAKIALETDPFVDGYSFWTFTDIFDENYFPSIPFHGGFGLLDLYGVPKPVYRAFQLLHGLGSERLPVVGTHETVDAWIVRKGRSITVLLTNHAQPRHDIVIQVVEVRLTDAPAPLAASIERIDEDHAEPAQAVAGARRAGVPEPLAGGAARGGLPAGDGAAGLFVRGPHGPLRRRSSPARGCRRHAGACTRAGRRRCRRVRSERSMNEQTLDQLQRAAFGYFLQAANPAQVLEGLNEILGA